MEELPGTPIAQMALNALILYPLRDNLGMSYFVGLN
jgi:hypothetical protein